MKGGEIVENIFFASQKDIEPLRAKSIANLNNNEEYIDISFSSEDLKKYFSKNIKKVVIGMGIH